MIELLHGIQARTCEVVPDRFSLNMRMIRRWVADTGNEAFMLEYRLIQVASTTCLPLNCLFSAHCQKSSELLTVTCMMLGMTRLRVHGRGPGL